VVEAFITNLPGGPIAVLATALATIGASAIALDAFEIIFVVVPILAPPVLMRVPDAVWVGVSILCALQASFLLPPFGAALMLTRSNLKTGVRLRETVRALTPYLAVQALVLILVLAMPSIVHVFDTQSTTIEELLKNNPEAAEKRLREMMGGQQGIPGLPGLPPIAKP
jgi:TRAP-type mannitol/chloroaromatic compound transport system permease large subunit